jgi:serine/threonine protein kinase
MEYVAGGNLQTLLENLGSLEEPAARKYMAEIIAAVNALHQLGYIHRDLKPANFLISRTGHIKLADFGLSKWGLVEDSWNSEARPSRKRPIRGRKSRKAYSLVGTPNYTAIEVIKGIGHDFTADWWSCGCILFEMLTGLQLFFGEDVEEVFEKIQQETLEVAAGFQSHAELLQTMSESAWNLIKSTVCAPETRLGKRGITDFEQHPFFEGIDWANLENQEPPFVPEVCIFNNHLK